MAYTGSRLIVSITVNGVILLITFTDAIKAQAVQTLLKSKRYNQSVVGKLKNETEKVPVNNKYIVINKAPKDN